MVNARKITIALGASLAALVLGTIASADISLQVTEIWPGNEPGSNLTEDWFELTNVGTMDWNAGVDGDLYYDDDSFDAGAADLMMGITSIAAGESVIFVVEEQAAVAEWLAVWQPDLTSLPQVGYVDGSGLSQGGDGVGIFLDSGFDGVDQADLIETEIYPDAGSNGGQSWDVVLQAFSVDGVGGAITTTAVNDIGQAAIGSPGVAVPEPSTAAMILVGMSAAMLRRRK